MKRLQPHSLLAACLACAILLIIGILANTVVDATTRPVHFNQIQAEPVFIRPTPTPAMGPPSPNLPATANQMPVQLTDRLAARPRPAIWTDQTDLRNFVAQVGDGQGDKLRGVFVPGIFALPVVQQPPNNSIFVSNKHDLVTQFQNAAQNGVIGLLAHNYLAGSLFYKLAPAHEVMLVYGDGLVERYRVKSVHRFQKLEPPSLRGNLLDLSTGKIVTAAEVFHRFYRGEHRLTFQTCLERNGRLDWGLMFIEAVPLEN
ncbi:MAG: hypothetical protein AB1801_06110 [Chloroflexota bacterium]